MSFKEVIGQENAVSLLKVAYRHNRIAHAYLFVGAEGIGKKKAALNFAKLLVCEDPKGEEPCDRCPSCLKGDAFNHPDIQMVSPEGQFIKIDAIREARRRLSLVGFESARKCLLIYDAQYLNDESSNALLKTLEEPTPNTVILLVADSIRSILPTIASRCQRIIFSPLSEKVIESILSGPGDIPAEEVSYLARMAQGSLGNARRYQKDALFERKNRIIRDALDRNYPVDRFIDWSIKDKTQRKAKIDESLRVLSTWFRDLFLAKISPGSEAFINRDLKDDIVRASEDFSLAQIEARLAAIAETTKNLERNLNVRILLTNMRVELWK